MGRPLLGSVVSGVVEWGEQPTGGRDIMRYCMSKPPVRHEGRFRGRGERWTGRVGRVEERRERGWAESALRGQHTPPQKKSHTTNALTRRSLDCVSRFFAFLLCLQSSRPRKGAQYMTSVAPSTIPNAVQAAAATRIYFLPRHRSPVHQSDRPIRTLAVSL